LSFD